MNRVLYLHPGWSKTGTSALQHALHGSRGELLRNGVLYPLSFQWKDHAHHDFALSFAPVKRGPYQSNLSPKDAIEQLDSELREAGAPCAILSSELSPLYFNNPRFAHYVRDRFDETRLLFTVRRQPELLLSLFSQLVGDPNVRYRQTLFYLFVQNVNWMQFHTVIRTWETFVKTERITVFVHSGEMVPRVLEFFGVPPDSSAEAPARINSSLPARTLLAVQWACAGIEEGPAYARRRDEIVELLGRTDPSLDSVSLFNAAEQAAIDNRYRPGNKILAERYQFVGEPLTKAGKFSDINCFQWQHLV